MITPEEQIIAIPAIVRKAELPSNTATAGILPRRIEVEASCEKEDGEGDIVLQRALLDASETFIKSGDIDLEHISKHGAEILQHLPLNMRFGSPNDYIIGRPDEVVALDGGRTLVKAHILGGDGAPHPAADWFWKDLERGGVWKASIYGTIKEASYGELARRLTVKSLNWTSLAMTRNPVNKSIVYTAKIIKSEIERIIKGFYPEETIEKAVDIRSLPSVREVFDDFTLWRLANGRLSKSNVETDASLYLSEVAPYRLMKHTKIFASRHDSGLENALELYHYALVGFHSHKKNS